MDDMVLDSLKIATFTESQKRVDLSLNFVGLHESEISTFIYICF